MTSRNSARLANRQIVEGDAMPISGTGSSELPTSSSNDERPPKKMARRSRGKAAQAVGTAIVRKGRSNQGKLAQLHQMPFDVLYEIFGYLHPLDVLHLARTAKLMRTLLMGSDSSAIWLKLLSNLDGAPQCPPDMDLPAYVRLLVEKRCHSCLTSCQLEPIWIYRTRVCRSCFKQKFTHWQLRGDEISFSGCFTVSWEHFRFPAELMEIIPRFDYRGRKGSLRDFISVSRSKAVRARVEQLKNDKSTLKKFIDEQKSLKAMQAEHARECQMWYRKHTRKTDQSQSDARSKRMNDIYSRLQAMGWGQEIEFLDSQNTGRLADHRLVNQTKELTERIWANSKNELVALMRASRPQRLRAERIEEMRKRLSLAKQFLENEPDCKPLAKIMPSAGDACLLSPIRRLIEETPSDVPVTKEALFDAVVQAPEFVDEWLLSKKVKLASLLPGEDRMQINADDDDKPQPSEQSARVDLATTFFVCPYRHMATFPRILWHRYAHYKPRRPTSDSEYDVALFQCGMFPWELDTHRCRFDEAFSHCAQCILSSCGLDGRTTTASEMDRLALRLQCSLCPDTIFVDWQCAVQYECYIQRSHRPNRQWTVLDAEDARQPPKMEWERMETFLCTRCNWTKLTGSELQTHLRIVHQIDREGNKIEEEDFERHPDYLNQIHYCGPM